MAVIAAQQAADQSEPDEGMSSHIGSSVHSMTLDRRAATVGMAMLVVPTTLPNLDEAQLNQSCGYLTRVQGPIPSSRHSNGLDTHEF